LQVRLAPKVTPKGARGVTLRREFCVWEFYPSAHPSTEWGQLQAYVGPGAGAAGLARARTVATPVPPALTRTFPSQTTLWRAALPTGMVRISCIRESRECSRINS